MWKQTIDIKGLISQGTTNKDVRETLTNVSQTLKGSLRDRLINEPNYDPEFQDLIDEMDSMAVIVGMQPMDVVDAASLREANDILMKIYAYGDKHWIWLG